MKRMKMMAWMLVVVLVLTASVAYASYDRKYSAKSYHIYSTLRTKKSAKDHMTNDNDICRRTSDSTEARFYTNAWSEGDKRATKTGYGKHGDTVEPKFNSGFGAIDAKYKLEMGNPNNYQVRMAGEWTPN